MHTSKIDEEFLKKIKSLSLPERNENNAYIALHAYGDGKRAPETFNVKVYTGKKGLKLVTNDYHTLINLIEGRVDSKGYNRIVYIDDSGWGFPLGGVLIGTYDDATQVFKFGEVDVKFFQGDSFKKQFYLDEYARIGIQLVQEFFIDVDLTLIKICTGFVNSKLKDKLRELGYNVDVAKIGEPLQSELEKKHKDYVKKEFNYDSYYDPKELTPNITASEFEKTVHFIKENNLMGLAKTGWDYFNKNSTQ